MTDIEQKALALVNEVRTEYPLVSSEVASNLALCRAIEQHEAFRQEVSDAVERWTIEYLLGDDLRKDMTRFIIAKPDPLAECLLELDFSKDEAEARHDAEWLVKTIEKRGGKIVWGEGA